MFNVFTRNDFAVQLTLNRKLIVGISNSVEALVKTASSLLNRKLDE